MQRNIIAPPIKVEDVADMTENADMLVAKLESEVVNAEELLLCLFARPVLCCTHLSHKVGAMFHRRMTVSAKSFLLRIKRGWRTAIPRFVAIAIELLAQR